MSASFSSRPNHPHDAEGLYTITAPAAEINTARRGVNHQWLQLDKIRTTADSLFLELREHIAVELRTEGNSISLECCCQAYRPGRHCGVGDSTFAPTFLVDTDTRHKHCFWALDQVLRASADHSLLHIPCNIHSDGANVTAATSNGYLRPRSIADSIGKKAMKKTIEGHLYAKVTFKVVVDRVNAQAKQTVLWLFEQERLAHFIPHGHEISTVGGGRSRTATTVHRDLHNYAKELFDAYEGYMYLIRRTDNLEEEYRAATTMATKVYISMMRSVVMEMLDPGLFSLGVIAERALYDDDGHGQGGYFWHIIDCFFELVRYFNLRLDPEQVDELRILKAFVDETNHRDQRTPWDTSVSQRMERWQE